MFEEPQRKDPVLKGEIQKVLTERGERAKIALEYLGKAREALRGAPYSNLDDDALFARTLHTVWMAETSIRSDVDWLSRDYGDTYLSNKAVDTLGQQIEKDMGLTYE